MELIIGTFYAVGTLFFTLSTLKLVLELFGRDR